MPFDPSRKYCGPAGKCFFCKLFARLLPEVVFGVNINYHCWKHDLAYATGDRRKKADIAFREDLIQEFEKAGRKRLGKLVAWVAYLIVRAGGWTSEIE